MHSQKYYVIIKIGTNFLISLMLKIKAIHAAQRQDVQVKSSIYEMKTICEN